MRRFVLSIITAVSLLFVTGCGNLSPRADPKLDQKIDNTNGKIGEIENMQNSMKAEVGTLRSQAEIQNSKLDRIQQGLVNLQQNNDNHGIMILSGNGGLVVAVFGLFCTTILLFHYRRQAHMHEKTANILAEKIVRQDSLDLENAVFEACLHTPVAENVLNVIKKQKSLVAEARTKRST